MLYILIMSTEMVLLPFISVLLLALVLKEAKDFEFLHWFCFSYFLIIFKHWRKHNNSDVIWGLCFCVLGLCYHGELHVALILFEFLFLYFLMRFVIGFLWISYHNGIRLSEQRKKIQELYMPWRLWTKNLSPKKIKQLMWSWNG